MRCAVFVTLALLGAALAASGCLGSGDDGLSNTSRDEPGGGTSSSVGPPAHAPTANETTGSLTGQVTDEEGLPIAGVRIDVLASSGRTPVAATSTDADGRFTVNGLAAGGYVLLLSRVGYHDASRTADVRANDVTDVAITLTPLPVEQEAFHESIPVSGHIFLDHAMVGWALWELAHVNSSQYNGIFCPACMFTFYAQPGAVDFLIETTWTRPVEAPVVNEDVWLSWYRNWTDAEGGTQIDAAYWKNGEGKPWDEDGRNAAAQTSEFRIMFHGGLISVSVDHKVDVWHTFSYHGPLPEGFSALPPE